MLKSYSKSYVDTDVTETDLANVLSTSGTTGIPKLVMRTHRSYIEEINSGIHTI